MRENKVPADRGILLHTKLSNVDSLFRWAQRVSVSFAICDSRALAIDGDQAAGSWSSGCRTAVCSS
jgi:hypothetical protein